MVITIAVLLVVSVKNIGKEPAQKQAFKMSLWLAALILAAIVALTYGRSLNFELTYFDDDAILLSNQTQLMDMPLKEAFLTDAEFGHHVDLYRPLANLSFLIDARIWGFNPQYFHLTGLLLHFLSVFLLFLILKKLGGRAQWSLLAAILFAVHPLFNITVSWLPARGDLLLAFFSLASFYAFLLFVEKSRVFFLVLSMLLAVLALFSKETAIGLPLVFLAYYILILRKKPSWSFLLLTLLVFGGGAILYFLLRSGATHPVVGGVFGLQALWSNIPTIPEVLRYFFIPFRIPVLPFYTLTASLIGLGILILFALLFYRKRNLRRPLLFVFGWFLIFTVPAMFYRPEWSSWCYEYCVHRSYLPLLAFFFLFAWIKENRKGKWERYLLVATSILILGLAIYSNRTSGVFRDASSFYTYAVGTNPVSALAQQNLGNALYSKKKFKEAELAYIEAARLHPDFADAWLNLGVLYARENRSEEAINCLIKSVDIRPDDAKALSLLAKLYMNNGQLAEAEKTYQKLLGLENVDESTFFAAAILYLRIGNTSQAMQACSSGLEKYPDFTDLKKMQAHLFFINGELEKARLAYLEILKISADAETYSNLAFVYIDQKNIAAASASFQSALKADANNPDALLGMAMVSVTKNETVLAEEFLNKAKSSETRLNNGMEGIKAMQADSYYFSEYQISILKRLFDLTSKVR